MEKELIQLYEAAQRAADASSVDGSPEEDRCIDALNRLKDFPVSYKVLVSSQVGKRLRGLTKHNSHKIKVLASEVVEIWKDIIVKETVKNRKNGEIKSESSVNVEKIKPVKVETKAAVKVEVSSSVGSPNSEKVKYSESAKRLKTEGGSPAAQVKVEKVVKQEKSSSTMSKPKQEPVNTPKLGSVVYCKDAVRDKMREILAESLCKVSSEVEDDLRDRVNACDPYRVAVMVETAMFEKWGKSTGIQKAKYRSVMFNLKDQKNPDFRRKVLLGEVSPDTITELTAEEMASDARQEQIKSIKEKALFECERGQAPQASTDKFKCGRCGKKETTYYQMQTRSADEPMTTYVTCVNCGNRWKFC